MPAFPGMEKVREKENLYWISKNKKKNIGEKGHKKDFMDVPFEFFSVITDIKYFYRMSVIYCALNYLICKRLKCMTFKN